MEAAGQGDCVVKLDNVIAGYYIIRSGLSIVKSFNPVLKGISLCIRQGERVAVIGESGSGKTTLLKVILGLLRPLRGRVFVNGLDIYASKKNWMEAIKNIGYVPQDPYKALDPRVKIKTSILEPVERSKIPSGELNRILLDTIKMVGLREEVLETYPSSLSGGMLQRVLIARAIISRPRILLLDEPTSALDVSTQAQIINTINEIYSRLKMSILLVTHDLAVAQYLADKAIILKDGMIVDEGVLEEIILRPKHEYTRILVKSYLLEIL
ncbi:ABC transporter ATP-binding protein [Thermogladius sp. 4427co]|uniref:ABC transporter ATP-binding protein n=1 Tax=Thermogladius sp. 4427co TaxID=3450718 RepID=UPI003F7A2219